MASQEKKIDLSDWEPVEDSAQDSSNPYSEWEPSKSIDTENESGLDKFRRGYRRTAADIGEGVLQGIEGLGNLVLPEMAKPRNLAKALKFEEGEIAGGLRNILDEKTEGYTAPQSEGEQEAGEWAKVIGRSLPGGWQRALGRIAYGVLGEGAKKLTTSLTDSETAGNVASIVLPVVTALATKNAKGVAREYYAKAAKEIPKNHAFRSKDIVSHLNRELSEIKNMPKTAERDLAIRHIKDVIDRYKKNPGVSIHTLLADKRNISKEVTKELGWKGDRSSPALLKTYKALDAPVHHYGDNVNPKFGVPFQQAEEAFRVGSKYDSHLRRLVRSISETGLGSGESRKLAGALMGDFFLNKTTAGIFKMLYRRGRESIESPVLREAYLKRATEAVLPNLYNIDASQEEQ